MNSDDLSRRLATKVLDPVNIALASLLVIALGTLSSRLLVLLSSHGNLRSTCGSWRQYA